MNYVPIPIHPSLLPIVSRLLTLAETEPLVSDTVVPIVMKAIEFAMTSGQVSDPDIWIRALKAASAQVSALKFDDKWLSMTRVE